MPGYTPHECSSACPFRSDDSLLAAMRMTDSIMGPCSHRVSERDTCRQAALIVASTVSDLCRQSVDDRCFASSKKERRESRICQPLNSVTPEAGLLMELSMTSIDKSPISCLHLCPMHCVYCCVHVRGSRDRVPLTEGTRFERKGGLRC